MKNMKTALSACLLYTSAHLIIVSNEVFRGGADYAGDTDAYLLALAQINNALAAQAENVCRVVCGIPKWVKGGNGLGRA